jgi:hypothetical protein
MMDRAERRYRTEKIAQWRASLYPSPNNFVGRFRKWNLTDQCGFCRMKKYYGAQARREKDERRNPLPEEVGL